MARSNGSKYRMTDAHKESLAEGRAAARTVKSYLEALAAHQPKRGRKPSVEGIEKRLAALDEKMAQAKDRLQTLQMVSERNRLQETLDRIQAENELPELELAFVEVAADYGTRKNINYGAWRSLGVPPAVLREAGIER